MIKTQNLVPEVYYNYSRDFQFLGRALDVIFNYAKMNADLISGGPMSANLDDNLVLLLTKTLGFETKHQYNAQDLRNICGVFASLIRDKGTKTAIERAVKTLMNAQNISGYNQVDIINKATESGDVDYTVKIYIPSDLKDLVLLEDLLDYILPAGYDYRFIYGKGGNSLKNTTGVENTPDDINVSNDLLGRITKPQVNDMRPDVDIDYVEDTGAGLTYVGKVSYGEDIEPFEDEGE